MEKIKNFEKDDVKLLLDKINNVSENEVTISAAGTGLMQIINEELIDEGVDCIFSQQQNEIADRRDVLLKKAGLFDITDEETTKIRKLMSYSKQLKTQAKIFGFLGAPTTLCLGVSTLCSGFC